MQEAIAVALIAVGVVLLVFGYEASQSIRSEVSQGGDRLAQRPSDVAAGRRRCRDGSRRGLAFCRQEVRPRTAACACSTVEPSGTEV